ncbi:MAG: glutamine--fructose-6-phosphate transaminase (isomerizing) [Chloroflexota bacterium]
MCGIFGYVAAREHDAGEVIDGLRYLEYRGYDSWGIALAAESGIVSEKDVGPIADARIVLPPSRAALGHTRWATHGGVTPANAHPHLDCGGRLALIHNGIVENHQELRSQLHRQHQFSSQTDTEVLVHSLEEDLEREEDLLEALLHVFRRVEGLSAVAVLDSQTGQIVAAKNGSPLAVGWAEDAVYLASDPIAILPHTHKITFIEDGQAAALSPDGIRIRSVATGEAVTPEVRDVAWDERRAHLGGYAHYMAKEIDEQPRIIRQIADEKQDDAIELAKLIEASRDVYLIGCGTANHAGISGRYMLSEIGGRRAGSAVASEMTLVEPLLDEHSLVIALSQSGETIDVMDAVKAARDRGAKVAALTNSEGSSLDRFADRTVLLNCGPERCVLSTKSYTAMLAVLQLTASLLGGKKDGAEELRQAGYRMASLLGQDSVREAVKETAGRIANQQHLFVLGRHHSYPLALEAALKIKEVSYMHAEGFAAGELKHGVIALVTYGTPCLILAPDDSFRREAVTAAAEVRARGALTIGLSPRPEPEFDITLPLSGYSSGPYEIAALSQLLAYELALLRGCDPDRPRNLAKSVTVR